MKTLEELARYYGSDKSETIPPCHGYCKHYEKFFKPLRKKEVTLLEIGLARKEHVEKGVLCPSLRMWKDYFQKGKVIGFDIEDYQHLNIERTFIRQGCQGSIKDLNKLIEEFESFDIIIDDGSHASYHQQLSLKVLFPALSPGGLYFIEDLNFQSEKLEKQLPPVLKTKTALKDREIYKNIISEVKEIIFFNSDTHIMERKKQEELVLIKKT